MTESVQVRLGDALVGHLPHVCCMTGDRAAGLAPIVVPKRLGAAWLLLIAGPIGAAVLLGLWPRIRVRYVIRLPMSDAAFERMHTLRVRRLWGAWLGAIGIPVSFGLWWMPILAIGVLGASLLGLGVALRSHLLLPWSYPSAIADAGGRRITLRGVHPKFAAAVTGARR